MLHAILLLSVSISAGSAVPLADAIQQGEFERAHRLLDQGAEVNATQADGMTALHWAVFHGKVDLAQRIVDGGGNTKAANRYGVQPLSISCRNGSGEMVALLLKSGADPDTQLPGGETALMTAARTGELGPVLALLEHDCNVDARERKGQTAIMWAAAEGNLAVVEALLRAGADFRTPLDSGFTPFFFAIREGRTEVVLKLLEAGIEVNEPMKPKRKSGKGPRPGTSPLLLATENGHLELAAALLEAGAYANDDGPGFTVLHAVTWLRKPIRGDGDPSPIGSGNLSSLELVRRLVAHGADVNSLHGKHRPPTGHLNKTGATPFLLAAETGDVPLMRLLVELGADPLLPNADRCTPLLAAAGVGALANGDESAGTEEDAIAAIELLLELGANLNDVDDHNQAAMHGAAYKSWVGLVHYLAGHGADIGIWNHKNHLGWTPLMIAQGNRPGNFRPSPETITAIKSVMRAAGVEPYADSE